MSFLINTVDMTTGCELVIEDDPEAFHELYSEREEIEMEIGKNLRWVEPMETRAGKERSKIKIEREANLIREESWDEYQNWLIDQGERFHEAFYGRVQSL